MFKESTIKVLNNTPIVKLYNFCCTSQYIVYNEVTMSAIYFLMKYNENEARICLNKLLELYINEEIILKEFN